MSFISIRADEIQGNLIKRIRDQWMLICSGSAGKANSMIGSWGFMGEMWGRDTAVCTIRPQRYTYEIIEKNATYALCFLPSAYRSVLNTFGSKSGRDINKVEGGPLTPAYKHGTLYYEEAELVLFCKKLYAQDLREELFLELSIAETYYEKKDFHRFYYGEILEVMQKE